MTSSNNGEFWIKKIETNIIRDREIDQKLNSMGWHVIRFWGREILRNVDECVNAVEESIFETKYGSDCC